MVKAQKIDKEFLLTDNSVNVYGFRLLTKGYQIERFKANPIGYRMHKRDDGVVLKWEDFRFEGDKLYAKPVINLSNPLGHQTAEEVQNGFLNAASMGGIVVLDFSEDPALMLPGQTGPTITKWYNKEVSLVDVPGNPNAVVQLFDANDNEINLTDFIQHTLKKLPLNLLGGFHFKKDNKMSLKQRIVGLMALAGMANLSDNSADEDVLSSVKNLVDTAKQVPDLQNKVKAAEADKRKALQDLADYKAAENAKQIEAITASAVEKGKLTAAVAKELGDKYANDPEALRKIVDQLPAYTPITSKIGAGFAKELADKSWEQLDKEGKLEALRAADENLFKAKFRERFGKEYKD